MNPHETTSTTTESRKSIPRHLSYQKVRDGRKHPIRGLWVRNGRFYGRLTVQDPNTGKKDVRRVPLEVTENGAARPVATIPEAQAAIGKLKVQRTDNILPVLKRTPKFNDFVTDYLTRPTTLNKTAKTIQTEKGHLNAWIKHLGEIRINLINKAMIAAFRDKRLKDGVSPRTVNLAVGALRSVLRLALDDEWIQRLPTENVRALTYVPTKRRLVALADIEKLCKAGMKVSKNGKQFRDYIIFMAFTGARCTQALATKWTDIDWRNRQIKIPRVGKGKQGGIVDFNDKLEAHLKDMKKRKAPDTDNLFPSPQRGKKDIAAKTFRETLKLARLKAKLPKFGFHDCRHFFASFCVMSGIDYMTIAKWLGHSDGGILIGKVYGHLSNEHAQAQAAKVRFEPVIIEKLEAKTA